MRRTKAEAEQTREAILVAAIEVFLNRGFSRATLDEIARVAGVTRGAVYWHFRDKLEILFALNERVSLPNNEVTTALKLRLADAPDLDPVTELVQTIGEALQSLENDIERRKILTILWLRCEYIDEMLPTLERLRRADTALQEQLLAIMSLVAERGRLASAWSPDMVARGLFLLLSGSVESWLRVPGGFLLLAETMPLVTAFLEAVTLPKAREAGGRV